MGYDEAVEAAARADYERDNGVDTWETADEWDSRRYLDAHRVALSAALPHLKVGYDREAIEAAERRGAVRALREAAAGEGLPDTLSRKYPKGRVRDWLLSRARRIEREGQK